VGLVATRSGARRSDVLGEILARGGRWPELGKEGNRPKIARRTLDTREPVGLERHSRGNMIRSERSDDQRRRFRQAASDRTVVGALSAAVSGALAVKSVSDSVKLPIVIVIATAAGDECRGDAVALWQEIREHASPVELASLAEGSRVLDDDTAEARSP